MLLLDGLFPNNIREMALLFCSVLHGPSSPKPSHVEEGLLNVPDRCKHCILMLAGELIVTVYLKGCIRVASGGKTPSYNVQLAIEFRTVAGISPTSLMWPRTNGISR